MPDQIKAHRVGGRSILVPADAGDDRGAIDEGERMVDHGRLKDLAGAGLLGGALLDRVRADGRGIGRLRVCAFTGDTDGDGRIDEPTALGARGVSILDAQTHEALGDTGDRLGRIILENWPELFNAGAEDAPLEGDKRSDNRGCEPEGVAVGEIDGVPLAFVGLERPGAVAVIDLREPGSPVVAGMTMIARLGHYHPEGLAFIPAGASPAGEPMLAVACELSGTVSLWRVAGNGSRASR